LSVAEYKRIQGFPDGWKLSGTLADKYRQLGNAVPVLLGKVMGTAMLNAI
jgi:DNA (cytosine-5)-methyltransferase 1